MINGGGCGEAMSDLNEDGVGVQKMKSMFRRDQKYILEKPPAGFPGCIPSNNKAGVCGVGWGGGGPEGERRCLPLYDLWARMMRTNRSNKYPFFKLTEYR